MTSPLVERLRTRLRADQVRDAAAELHLYRHDASNMSGQPAAVCFAESVDDVRRIVLVANEFGVPFVARGFAEKRIAHGVENRCLPSTRRAVDEKESPRVEQSKVQFLALCEWTKGLDV